MQTYMGVKIVFSQHATKLVYHWPDKKRSRRLIKKMTKRLGPQITTEPTAYVMADGKMVVHPSIYENLRKQYSDAASRPCHADPYPQTQQPPCRAERGRDDRD